MEDKSKLLKETLEALHHGNMLDSVRFVYTLGKSCLEDYRKLEKFGTDEDRRHAKIMEASLRDPWEESLIRLLDNATTEEAVAVYTNTISKMLVNIDSASRRIGYFGYLQGK